MQRDSVGGKMLAFHAVDIDYTPSTSCFPGVTVSSIRSHYEHRVGNSSRVLMDEDPHQNKTKQKRMVRYYKGKNGSLWAAGSNLSWSLVPGSGASNIKVSWDHQARAGPLKHCRKGPTREPHRKSAADNIVPDAVKTLPPRAMVGLRTQILS